MSYFEFPHTRTYDSDLGWIIRFCSQYQIKTDDLMNWRTRHEAQYAVLADKVEGLINSLVDVIVPWDSSIAYHIFSIVEYQGQNYIAVQDVPVGVMITNTAYWQPAATVIEQVNAIGVVVDELRRTRPYVTPEMFGAAGDGVTDDTAAIQAMLISGVDLCIMVQTYLVGSSAGDATLFNLTGRTGLRIIGGGLIKDARTPVANQSAYAIFQLNACSNVEIDVNYQGQPFTVSVDTLRSTGYTFVAAYSCSDVSVHAHLQYCRQGIQGEIFRGTGRSSGIRAEIVMEDCGYAAALYNCSDIVVRAEGEDFHRLVYLAGCHGADIYAQGQSDYSSASPVLLTDHDGEACTCINVTVRDTGSNFTGEVGLLGLATQDTSTLDFNINADITVEEGSNGSAVSFTGFNANLVESKINIIDRRASPLYMAINTGRIGGSVSGLILSVQTAGDVAIGSDCMLINSACHALNLVSSHVVGILNSKADVVYTSGDGSGSCSVIGSDLRVPAGSFQQVFDTSQFYIGATRPTLTSTQFCLMYDTTAEALLIHQGNYWYKLADKGAAV